MNIKNFLWIAGLAGLIAAGSSVKPTQDKHRDEVTRILSVLEATEKDTSASREFYEARNDLKTISAVQLESLVRSHAKLSAFSDLLTTGKTSTQDFLIILQTKDPIITDENTKLKISTNFWKDIGSLSCHGNELWIRTDSHSPDRILRNFSTKVEMKGGELTVSFLWTEFETKARQDKEQFSASTDSTLVGTATYTISAGLVLAQ